MKWPGLRARALSAVVAFLVTCAAGAAHAGGDLLVTLDYATDSALADCPSASEFRREVARQLGQDPFREGGAAQRIVVRLHGVAGGRTEGRVEWRKADDQWEGERTFFSHTEGCAHLARAVALATAIQIQLLAAVGGDQQATPSAAPPPLTPAHDDARRAPAAPVPVITDGTAAAPPSREPRIAVDVGMGVFQDLGGAPAIISPRVALSLGRPASVAMRLAASGFGPGAEVSRPGGVAQLDRLALTLELVRFFRPGRRIQPLLAVGGGVQDVRVRGISDMPTVAHAHDGQVFSGMVAGSGGLAFVIGTRLFVMIEAEALVFRPAVRVVVGSGEGAHLDGVAVFPHGGFLARF